MDNPLVSLCLISYKQEEFVREAIKSAFAQTYQPLQIVLSDDSSPDGTFAILQQEAGSYKGPHEVVVTRTPENAGLIGNMNHGLSHCRGEFIIIQAGDDVSLPHRAETLVKYWQQAPQVDLVVSDVIVIDENSAEVSVGWPQSPAYPLTVEEAIEKERCYAIGCAVGYSNSVIESFDPIDSRVIQEDWVVSFRALAARGIRIVPEPLLKYRKHRNNLWFAQNAEEKEPTREQYRRYVENRVSIAREWLRAWDRLDKGNNEWRRKLEHSAARWQSELECCDLGRLGAIKTICKGIKRGLNLRSAAGLMKRHVLRTAPLRGAILAAP